MQNLFIIRFGVVLWITHAIISDCRVIMDAGSLGKVLLSWNELYLEQLCEIDLSTYIIMT